jgi:hypothetical protein
MKPMNRKGSIMKTRSVLKTSFALNLLSKILNVVGLLMGMAGICIMIYSVFGNNLVVSKLLFFGIGFGIDVSALFTLGFAEILGVFDKLGKELDTITQYKAM